MCCLSKLSQLFCVILYRLTTGCVEIGCPVSWCYYSTIILFCQAFSGKYSIIFQWIFIRWFCIFFHRFQLFIVFEYDIPRLGKRIDVVLLLEGIVFCVEKFNTLLASCCKVDVVNGKGAFLILSPFFTSSTTIEAFSICALSLSTSSLFLYCHWLLDSVLWSCARVASYQNLSFCWTVPSFLSLVL